MGAINNKIGVAGAMRAMRQNAPITRATGGWWQVVSVDVWAQKTSKKTPGPSGHSNSTNHTRSASPTRPLMRCAGCPAEQMFQPLSGQLFCGGYANCCGSTAGTWENNSQLNNWRKWTLSNQRNLLIFKIFQTLCENHPRLSPPIWPIGMRRLQHIPAPPSTTIFDLHPDLPALPRRPSGSLHNTFINLQAHEVGLLFPLFTGCGRGSSKTWMDPKPYAVCRKNKKLMRSVMPWNIPQPLAPAVPRTLCVEFLARPQEWQLPVQSVPAVPLSSIGKRASRCRCCGTEFRPVGRWDNPNLCQECNLAEWL